MSGITPTEAGSGSLLGERHRPQDSSEDSAGRSPKTEEREVEPRRVALDEGSPKDYQNAEDHSELGGFHYDQFLSLGNLIDIEKAIEYETQATELTPDGHSELPCRLSNLGVLFNDRYQRLGEIGDLENAIEYRSRALELTPDDHPDLPDRLTSLGASYNKRYRRQGGLDDLEKSLEYLSRALELTPDGHPGLPDRLSNLGVSYSDRYQCLGDLGDLEKSLEYRSRALDLTPNGHPDLPSRFSNLGESYNDRYRCLGELGDLGKSLEYFSRALTLTPDDHSELPDRLTNLGASYNDRYQCLGEIGDLERSLEYISRAVKFTPDGHLDLPSRLSNLGAAYTDRYQRLGEIGDLEKSLKHISRAVKLTPDDHPDLPDRLTDLGVSYTDRFRRLGRPDDLGKSLEYHSRALELTPDGYSDLPLRLSNLGVTYADRYQRLGELGDLEKSLEYISRVVELTPEGHPDLPDRLGNLGMSFSDKYKRLGEIVDLEKALECDSRALHLTPDGHPDLPLRLTSLGVSYTNRYRRLGEIGDLEEALECNSRALDLTPDGHPDLPGRLSSLGVSYTDRYERLGDFGSLEKALECDSRALTLTPGGHPDLPHRLTSLGMTYTNRYQQLGEIGDLEKALECDSRALDLTPDGHPDLPARLSYLGVLYGNRYRRLEDLDDLEKSLDTYLSRRHFHCALSCLHNYERTADSAHLNKALHHFRQASHSITSTPRDRFQFTFEWAKHASEHPSLNCIEAFHAAIDLLPQFIWLGTTATQRYHDLSLAENLAVRAASAAILHSDPKTALEWLEHARCVVWSQTLMLRSPLAVLKSSHPELATRLQSVSKQLHEASSGPSESPPLASGSDGIEYRYRLARQYDDLLSQARQLPGFQDLLWPMKSTGLVRAARYGPIVVITCHEDHCHALIIQPGSDNVRHLPLPNFTYSIAQHSHSEIITSLRRKGIRERGVRIREEMAPNDTIGKVLGTLWDRIVKPILDFLGYTKPDSPTSLPHITWCPTGAISFLPLHAAGDYDQPGSRLFDYAVSSYTPTLSALLSCTPSSFNSNCRVLTIGQEATPGHKPLPGTSRELAYLRSCLANVSTYCQLVGDEATTTAVLEAMEQHDWVHLACHAHQNVDDPTKSGFFLHDGTLDLAAINQRSFSKKGLAFLSACQTATGDEKLPDEAIHLASGMLMAGYSSVIGTMWSVADDDAPFVANKVYAQLMKEGKLGNGEAGRALHNAVSGLREKVGEKEFGWWVPYIHIGS